MPGRQGLDEAKGRHQTTLGQDVERASLVIVEGQLGRRSEQHRHHAVVAGQSAHHAGVAVDSCCHGRDTGSGHRHLAHIRHAEPLPGEPALPAVATMTP